MKTAFQILSLLCGILGLALSMIGIMINDWLYIFWGVILLGISFVTFNVTDGK